MTLDTRHHAMLRDESGIADTVITQRGYATATGKAELVALGFADFQCCAPALVLPMHDVHGKSSLYQIRPDKPRKTKKGKRIKYDTPQGSHITLDVHPAHQGTLDQTAIPLIVVEGLKKADSITSHLTPDQPHCVIGLVGVYGWMRDKKPLPDWRKVALKGRKVLIVFDSDATEIPDVGKARQALATFLKNAGAQVYHADLPALPDGEKCGADDFLLSHTLADLLELVQETFPKPKPLITNLADVEEQPTEWLWWPYLPRGAFVLLDGDPGVGKSLLTIQLAACFSRGWKLPDQQGQPTLPTGGPQRTLLITAEDSVSRTIKKRCRECGGDDRYIDIFTEWQDADGTIRPFTLQAVALLDEALSQQSYAMVIIDPLQAFLGDIDIHRANETRPVLQAFTKVLERHNVTALCVRHPAKGGQSGGKAIYRGLGTIDFIGAARTALFVEQHPTDETKALLCQTKTNLERSGRTQVFSKADGRFTWAGVSRLSAEMIAGDRRGPDPHAFFEAICWLEHRLEGGLAWPAADLMTESEDEGHNKKTLYKAKKAIGIIGVQLPDGWTWRLPPLSVLPPPLTCPSGLTGLTDLTGLTGVSDSVTSEERTDPPDTPDTPDRPETPERPVRPVVEGGMGDWVPDPLPTLETLEALEALEDVEALVIQEMSGGVGSMNGTHRGNGSAHPCYACHGTVFRKNAAGDPICERCHPRPGEKGKGVS